MLTTAIRGYTLMPFKSKPITAESSMGKTSMSMRRGTSSGWQARAGLLLLFVLPISGCGGGPPSGTVTGTVTFKGAPLTTGRVIFYGANNQTAIAQIGEDGNYEAIKVPLGLVKVAVDTPPPPSRETVKAAKTGKRRFERGVPISLPENTVSIPAKYGNPELSGFSLTVKEGSQPYDIALK